MPLIFSFYLISISRWFNLATLFPVGGYLWSPQAIGVGLITCKSAESSRVEPIGFCAELWRTYTTHDLHQLARSWA